MSTPLATEILVLNGVDLLSGAADPSIGAGVAAPVGSLYLRTDGTLWIKTGVPNTAWASLSAGVGNAQRFTYTASGAEGSSFNVPLPATRANANYLVFVNQADVVGGAALMITCPATGRTNAQFPVIVSSSLVGGEVFEFYVADPT
jgi:hypothetical protein